jgi:hypothetical protein
MLKCWVIQVNTIAYENLKISSKMQTGGNNPGPRDFKVQYRIGITGTWTDVPNSTLVTANNWSSAVLDSLAVPEACKNQQSVFFRWIMTTNTNSSGGTVAATGINKIDDIYLTGKLISTAVAEHQGSASFSVSPNPAAGPFEVSAQEPIESIDITDLNGRIVFFSKDLRANSIAIQSNILGSGNYMVRIHTCSGRAGAKKVVVL